MAGIKVDPPPVNMQIIDMKTGRPTRPFIEFLHRIWKRTGGDDAVSDHVALADPHAQYAEIAGGSDANFTAMPQVGGDPIVESGSNADGYWTRWSDGTQAAWFTFGAGFTADAGSERSSGVHGSATFNNDEYKWSYPVSFLSVPSVSSQTDAIHNSANAFSATPSLAKLGIFGFNGSVTGQVVSASAIGRWK